MRTATIAMAVDASKTECRKTRERAKKECPWAAKIVKVCGGFRCFESVEEYRVWKNQK